MGYGKGEHTLFRFRLHPATVAPMPPYWWKSESPRLRSGAQARRREMTVTQRRLWDRLSGEQLGTECFRGVVVAGRVVDWFVPEARLIIDAAPCPQGLGNQLAWFTVMEADLRARFDHVLASIQEAVAERAGVVAYVPGKQYTVPELPPFGSPRMRAMLEALTTRTTHAKEAA